MPAILAPSPTLSRLWLLPLISSVSWLLTLLSLFSIWVARGRPKYPGQSNPYFAFIFDIGAVELKPLLLVGTSITSVSFFATVWNVHKFRIYAYTQHHSRIRGAASMFSVLAGLVAGASLILMAGLDTFRFHTAHKFLMLAHISGIGLVSVLMTVVWADQMLEPGRLRKWYISNTLTVIIGAGVSVAFFISLRQGSWKLAGTLEWIVGALGTLWISTFMGILRFPDVKASDNERTPLLNE